MIIDGIKAGLGTFIIWFFGFPFLSGGIKGFTGILFTTSWFIALMFGLIAFFYFTFINKNNN